MLNKIIIAMKKETLEKEMGLFMTANLKAIELMHKAVSDALISGRNDVDLSKIQELKKLDFWEKDAKELLLCYLFRKEDIQYPTTQSERRLSLCHEALLKIFDFPSADAKKIFLRYLACEKYIDFADEVEAKIFSLPQADAKEVLIAYIKNKNSLCHATEEKLFDFFSTDDIIDILSVYFEQYEISFSDNALMKVMDLPQPHNKNLLQKYAEHVGQIPEDVAMKLLALPPQDAKEILVASIQQGGVFLTEDAELKLMEYPENIAKDILLAYARYGELYPRAAIQIRKTFSAPVAEEILTLYNAMSV